MCIVIDANIFCSVFDTSINTHHEFKPILNWIINKDGKMVIGGRLYTKEVFVRIQRFNRLISELVRAGKVVRMDDDEVDAECRRIAAIKPDPNFDDKHIVALLSVSGCRILGTNDARSFKYVKDKSLYRKPHKPPRIYKSKKHGSRLLCDKNIAGCCR